MHGEGISTLRIRHKGQQPLINMQNHDFKFILFFPFYVFHPFGVDKSGALTPTYPQL